MRHLGAADRRGAGHLDGASDVAQRDATGSGRHPTDRGTVDDDLGAGLERGPGGRADAPEAARRVRPPRVDARHELLADVAALREADGLLDQPAPGLGRDGRVVELRAQLGTPTSTRSASSSATPSSAGRVRAEEIDPVVARPQRRQRPRRVGRRADLVADGDAAHARLERQLDVDAELNRDRRSIAA